VKRLSDTLPAADQAPPIARAMRTGALTSVARRIMVIAAATWSAVDDVRHRKRPLRQTSLAP